MAKSDSWANRVEDRPQGIDPHSASADSSLVASTHPQESGALDRTELLERVGGDRELLADIVELFLRNCPKELAEIREAIARGDAGRIQRAAHTLKGEVSNLASAPAAAAALRLELMGREGELAGAKEGFATLERAIEELKVALISLVREVR